MTFSPKMDRAAFRIQSHEEEEQSKVFTTSSPTERLAIATHLIKSAYGLLRKGLPPMDKTCFVIRQRD